MSSKSKGSVVLAMLLFLGSAPTWAASVEGRSRFVDSSASSAFSNAFSSAVSGAVSGWLGSVLQAGRSTVKAIWGEYGIAIDPDGQPVDPSHASESSSGETSTN